MLQNGSTNHNVALGTRLWRDTTPSIAVETTQKQSKNGLESSRWASSHGKPAPIVLAAFKGNMELPGQGFYKVGYQVDYQVGYQVADGSDLEMDHGHSLTIGPRHVSKIPGFNATTARFDNESWGGVDSQHQFDSEVAIVDGDGDVVMMDLNDPGTIMMVDQVARDERQAENTSEYADVRFIYPWFLNISQRLTGIVETWAPTLGL